MNLLNKVFSLSHNFQFLGYRSTSLINISDRSASREKPSNLFIDLIFLHLGFGRKDIVEFLLEVGANVHARDDGGLIPLHNACSFGHVEVTLSLLRHDADVNARDNWNFTPLHEAGMSMTYHKVVISAL